MRARSAKTRAGLTIVECLLAITILAATALSATYTVVAGNQHAARGDLVSRASRVAASLIEEICSKSYEDPAGNNVFGPDPGEDARTKFDDVDDYNGFSEAVGDLANAAGVPYPADDQIFGRSVTVGSATQNLGTFSAANPGLKVTVTVRHQSGEQWQFERFIPRPPQ